MSFMQRQVTGKTQWYQVETTAGIEYLPVDLIGKEPADSDAFTDYCEGKVIWWEQIEGYGARLRAPGYLDCTEWTVFSTESDAEDYLETMYPEDEED